MNITTDSEMKTWLQENLVDKNIGAEITGQSVKGFEQSVRLNYIQPYFLIEGKGHSKIRLYKRSELENYRDTKKN